MEITTAAPIKKPDVIVRLTADEARLLKMVCGGLTALDLNKAMIDYADYKDDDDYTGHDLLTSIYEALEDLSY